MDLRGTDTNPAGTSTQTATAHQRTSINEDPSPTARRKGAQAVKYIIDEPQQSQSSVTKCQSHKLGSPLSLESGNTRPKKRSCDPTPRIIRSKKRKRESCDDDKEPKRHEALPAPSISLSGATSTSSSLISRVREDLELEFARLGRKRSIMDFVLDSRSPSVDYPEEILLEIAFRSRRRPYRHNYRFAIGHEHNIREYWEDQARIWDGVSDDVNIEHFASTRFPDSYARAEVRTVGSSSRREDLGHATNKTQGSLDRLDKREISEMLIRRLSNLATLLRREN